MRLIFERKGILTDDTPNEDIDRTLDRLFRNASNHEYGWRTETVERNPAVVRFVATSWNEQVRNEFIRLVADRERLDTMQLDSRDTAELASVASAMDDIHNFYGFWHVLERNDHVRDGIEFHALIHPLTLSRIQAHPGDFVLVTGYTRIVC